MLTVPFGMPSRKDGPPSIWDTHGILGNVFANPTASSAAPYPQEMNPWSSHISEHSSPHVMSESQTPAQDQRCQSGPSARNSFVSSEWRFSKSYGADQQRLQIPDPLFDKFTTSATFAWWKKIQYGGMYLLTISNGSYAVDQRSGDGWISGWYKNFVICKRNSNTRFWSTRYEDCFSTEPNHPEYTLQEKGQSGGTKGSKRGPFPSRKTDRLPDLRVLPVHWSRWFRRELCRPIYYCSSKWWFSGIRFKMGRFFLSMTKIPLDDILEGLYKLRIRESEKLKTVLELYDLETHQKKLGPDDHRLKTMVKRSIEQD